MFRPSGISPRQPAGWVARAAVVLCWLLAAQGAALAHAALIGSDPADGAVVATPPRQLTLTFSEPVSPLALKLVVAGGAATPLETYRIEGPALIVTPPELAQGTHVVSWRVVSADGHPVGGSFAFSVGAPSANGGATVVDAVGQPVRVALWLARLCLYCGLFLGVGGAFFAAWVGRPPRTAGRIVAALTGLGIAAGLLSLGLQGLDALAAPLVSLGRPTVWATGLSTSYATTAIGALIALAAGLASMAAGGVSTARLLSAAALALVGLALAASGHASAAEPQWLTRPMVFLHGTSIAFWAGALIPLGSLLAKREPGAAEALRRFSRLIPWALAPLVAAGLVLAVIQVGSWSGLVDTAYGRVLLAKIALLAVLFCVAAYNRWRLTGAAAHGAALAVSRLSRTVTVEIALVVAIFATAALWRFTPPPRALALAAAVPASVHIHTAEAMADVTIAPGHAGEVEASIYVMDGAFGALPAREVTLVLSRPDGAMEPVRRQTRSVEGVWQTGPFTLPLPGRWMARVEVLVSDFEMRKLEGEIDIRP